MPSSVIASFHYDESNSALEILFVSGITYIYSDVPKNVFDNMRKAKSKGVYFNEKIKGNYNFERRG